MAGLIDQIEPLKQTALAELKSAPDLAALEQTKGAWLGANGRFTALMKQLGTLSKEEKPAAGKLIKKLDKKKRKNEFRNECCYPASMPVHHILQLEITHSGTSDQAP